MIHGERGLVDVDVLQVVAQNGSLPTSTVRLPDDRVGVANDTRAFDPQHRVDFAVLVDALHGDVRSSTELLAPWMPNS